MKRFKRGIYRFRARIYGRLPKNKSLLKSGILCLFFLCFGLFLKIKATFPQVFGGEETGMVSGTTVVESKEQEENNLQNDAERQTMENGYLSIDYIKGTVVTVPPSVTNQDTQQILPEETEVTESGGTLPIVEEEATETGVQPIISMTGMVPQNYPVLSDIIGKKYLLENMRHLDYLKDNFYIVNATTKMTTKDFPVEQLLNMDLSIEKSAEPQILIYHSHASEAFIDSRKGETEDTVVGMGARLAEYLTKKYGYQVLHETTVFDRKNGKDNRSYAYNDALPYIENVLKENPAIEVVIDLHRDEGVKRVATIQGKQVAKVMLFNGLCRNTSGELQHLPNPNLTCNLAFSLQTKLIGDEMYPGLMHRIFLKDYRYNMHLAGRYMLIELGTANNTVEEAANAMEPLADILAQVLK